MFETKHVANFMDHDLNFHFRYSKKIRKIFTFIDRFNVLFMSIFLFSSLKKLSIYLAKEKTPVRFFKEAKPNTLYQNQLNKILKNQP